MSIDPAALDKIDEVLSTYREPGILLHRPYPPGKFPDVRSKLGGLPALPATLDWPRGRNPQGEDVPLHFLAQVDCGELPDLGSDLPTEGMLFFFARDDEEQIWGKENAHDHARVIYAPAVANGQQPRDPPADLRPVKDRGAPVSYKPEWILPEEAGPAVHFSWPLVALPLDTWPDASALSIHVPDGYERRVEAFRTGAFIAATGLPSRSLSTPDWARDSWTPFSLPNDRYGNTRFPQLGIMIDRVSRRVIRAYPHKNARPEQVAHVYAKASSWIARAEAIGLDAAPSDGDVDAFQGWLHELASERFPPSHLRAALPSILSEAVADAITFAASAPGAATLVPRYYYDVMENCHLPVRQQKHAERGWQLKTRVHQMLGHAPASQDAVPVDGGPVCLLQLASDPAMEFMFGDLGEDSFWIGANDLVAKRFDKAWASLAGH
jgi:uncharacterized protein YwqG